MSSHVPAVSSGGRIALAGATGRIGSVLAGQPGLGPRQRRGLDQGPSDRTAAGHHGRRRRGL